MNVTRGLRPPPGRWWRTEFATEGAAEGGIGLVADVFGDPGQGRVAMAEPGGADGGPSGHHPIIYKTRHGAGMLPPSLWGMETHLHTLFGADAATIAVTPRIFNFRYRSAAHVIEVFRTWYGPVHKAFAALPVDQAEALERDLTDLLNSRNVAGTRALVVPSEYLDIVITRR